MQYGLDGAGRIQSVTWNKQAENPVTLASAVNYLPFGPVSHMTLGNGLTLDLGYDQRYQLTSLAHGSALDLAYSYDNAGNIIAIADNLDVTRDQTLVYDSQYRLAEATDVLGMVSYSYDQVGNRLSRTSDSGVSETYEYAAGTNRLQKISGSINKRIAYDETGKPVLMAGDIPNPVPAADYVSNGLGQRILKTVNGVTTVFHYDQSGNLMAESAGDGTLKRAYVYLDGLRLATIDIALSGPAQIYYHHNDHLGAPQRLTDATGAVVWQADYDPFGQAVVDPASTVVNNFRLPGQYFDAETGLHYNWHRYYDPQTGRYLSPDPIGLAGGINLYTYVGGNPVNYIDPWGLRYAESWGAGGAAVGGSIALGGSIVVDAATGGLNILATPSEVAGGMALGGTIGYGLGSALDWMMNENTNGNNDDQTCGADDNDAGKVKKLSPGEIKKLINGGEHPHNLKPKPNSRYDLYKDKNGNIEIRPKGGKGPGEPTGININDF
ncbi:MAG: RHS domain-containing protein [Deltaproteobacteria bacterium]|nr:RHS domain-containing protein [Deltaproteobacteria bacterium]